MPAARRMRGAWAIGGGIALALACSGGSRGEDRSGAGGGVEGPGGIGGIAGADGIGNIGGSGPVIAPGGARGDEEPAPDIHRGENLRFWEKRNGVPGPVRSIAADRGGNVWAANEAGLLLLRPGSESWERFGRDDGLPQWETIAVAGGREGQVWVGYRGLFPDENYFDDPPEVARSGDVDLFQLEGSTLRHVRHYDISTPPGVEPGYPEGRDLLRTCFRIVPVLEGPWAGDVWFGCNHGVAMWNETFGQVQEHQHTAIWRDGQDWTGDFRGLLLAPGGNVWIAGAHRGGLLRYGDEGGQFWAAFAPEIDFWPDEVALDPLGDDWTMALAEDGRGGLWAGSFGNGLAHVAADGDRTWITSAEGLPDDRVTDLALDTDGSLWVATDAGVVRLRDGAFDLVLPIPGTPLSVHVDAGSTPRRVLVGTSEGAAIYDGP